MELFSKRFIKSLLKKYEVSPKKRFGQHFLINRTVLKEIIAAADLEAGDIVLEIGPGSGNLTQELAKRVKKVIAVEKDPKMIAIMKETLKDFGNLEVIQADILKLKAKIPKDYKVVANLPYYIVSPVIRKFLETKNPPKEMVLMVQKEVAQRICAKPPEMSILAVSVQFYAKPKIISYVSKKSFWPQPKVDSAILKIIPKERLAIFTIVKNSTREKFREVFFRIVKAGFSQPRKQLVNNLSNGLKLNKTEVKSWLLKNNLQPSQRAETLRVEDWIKLALSLLKC